MSGKYDYHQYMDIRFEHQEVIDVPRMVEECREKWFNQTLTRVNDSVARLGIIEGEYHWHQHENEDEFFFVLSGRLLVDVDGKTIELNPHQGTTISKGMMHRTRAPEKTVILMVEAHTIDPVGSENE